MKLVLLLGSCLAGELCESNDQYSELVRKLKEQQGKSDPLARTTNAIIMKHWSNTSQNCLLTRPLAKMKESLRNTD